VAGHVRGLAGVSNNGVLEWSPRDVAEWARRKVGIDEEDANVLEKMKYSGESLPELRKHELIQAGMPGGVASKLMKAVRELVLPPLPGVWHHDPRLSASGRITLLPAFTRKSVVSARIALCTYRVRLCSTFSCLAPPFVTIAQTLSFLPPTLPPSLLLVIPRCAEPKTILIDLSEGKKELVSYTIESQIILDKLQEKFGAGGLMNGTSRAVLKFEELVDGDTYIFLYDESSGITKLKANDQQQQGQLDNIASALEKEVTCHSSARHASVHAGPLCVKLATALWLTVLCLSPHNITTRGLLSGTRSGARACKENRRQCCRSSRRENKGEGRVES